MLRHGTTTAEVKSGYGLTVADEAKQLRAAATPHALRRELTFLGAHFVPPEYAARAEDYIRLVCDEMIPACASLARWCDVFCDEGAFTVAQARRVLIAGAAAGLSLRIHADELARSGGSLLAAELGCASADHLIHATGEEIAAMKAAGVVAVMLPGTSYTLGIKFAPARSFLEAGVTIALASDFNPGSCNCENLQTMISLACQGMKLTPDEALYAATVGGAAALRRDDVGSLAVGKRCDFSVLVAESRSELPYHFGVNLVSDVVVGGRVVVRAGAVVHDAPAPDPVPAVRPRRFLPSTEVHGDARRVRPQLLRGPAARGHRPDRGGDRRGRRGARARPPERRHAQPLRDHLRGARRGGRAGRLRRHRRGRPPHRPQRPRRARTRASAPPTSSPSCLSKRTTCRSA